MPTTTQDFGHSVYVRYSKMGSLDVAEFREKLLLLSKTYEGGKDIIIDLAGCGTIGSAEVGALARAVTAVERHTRHLHLVASPGVRKILEETGIPKRENVIVHENVQDLVAELKKKETPPEPSQGDGSQSTVVRFEGMLSGQKVKEMTAQIEKALHGTSMRVIIDLSKVELIDSVCIGQLMHLEGVAKSLERTIALAGPQDQVLEVLHDACLDQILEILPPQ